MRIGSIFLTAVALLLSLTGIATTTTADQLTGSVTVSLAPGGASLTSTSGTWIWGPATAASLDCPGCYQLNLNGASNGTGNAIEAEIANGGQLYAYNPGGWYVWNGSWVWVMDAPTTPEKPGPSAQLFADPYYTCVTNYYVATTGNDTNTGSSSSPWATLAHANRALLSGGSAAGTCINVEPGTYSAGVDVTKGGNLASSTGYVVYRCTSLDACTVTDPGNNGSTTQHAAFAVEANYVMIDGFTITSSASPAATFSNGIAVSENVNVFVLSRHHVWALNNTISGYGETGILYSQGDYGYVIHNTFTNNAIAPNCDSGAQGSGFGIVLPIALSSYTPTADDQNNKVVGDVGTAFRQFVEWNVAYNNHLTPCSDDDTDGNGIIMDTWSWGGISGGTPYISGGLIAFNLSYDNGGGGVHIQSSDYVTVANNSCYNNTQDTTGQVSTSCIDTNQSYGNTIINNIAIAIPTAPPAGGCVTTRPVQPWSNAILGGPPVGDPADTFSNNITQLLGYGSNCWNHENPMFNADTYSCSSNKCATSPQWVNVGNTSVGTEITPPVGANFALESTSPAIGYGLSEPYLSPQSVDAGACYHTLSSCP
jgi:hypothetical protein